MVKAWIAAQSCCLFLPTVVDSHPEAGQSFSSVATRYQFGQKPSLLDYAASTSAEGVCTAHWQMKRADNAGVVFCPGRLMPKKLRTFAPTTWRARDEDAAPLSAANYIPAHGFLSFRDLHKAILQFQYDHKCTMSRKERRACREGQEVKALRRQLADLRQEEILASEATHFNKAMTN